MIKVYVSKQSNYPISSPALKNHLRSFLKDKGIVSDSEVTVAIVSDKKMLDIAKKYMKDDKVHNVLSFSDSEVDKKFVYPPSGIMSLGEIVICYSQAVKEAKKENKLIKDKVNELVEHGALHLLGFHHE